LPIARYFIFVGGTLAVLLFIPGWLLPNLPATFADQSVALDRAVIRIKSAHKWPEKVILDTSQLTITPPVVMDPPPIQWSIPLASDKAPDQSSLAATALLKPDTQPAHQPTPQSKFRVARTARSRRAARRPIAHRRTAMTETVASLGGLIAVKQARTICRPSVPRHHRPRNDVRPNGRN
jgi:hypothetical protein